MDNQGAGDASIAAWGNQDKPKLAVSEAENIYTVTLTGTTISGFQLVDADTGAETQFDGQSEEVKAINAITTDTSIYYLRDGKGGMKWYKDADKIRNSDRIQRSRICKPGGKWTRGNFPCPG